MAQVRYDVGSVTREQFDAICDGTDTLEVVLHYGGIEKLCVAFRAMDAVTGTPRVYFDKSKE
jgi:hypothetical protein